MPGANISKKLRKAVYARDFYRCALCDSMEAIQIHHAIPRSKGGNSTPYNLITLCWRCHGMCHGVKTLDATDLTPEDVQQAAIEYLADYYAPDWYPLTKDV